MVQERGRHRTSSAVVGTVALLAGFALVAGACGLGDKAGLEDLITGAPARLDDQVVRGTLSVESRFIEAPVGGGTGGFGAPAAPTDQFEIPEGGLPYGDDARQFVLDLGSNRSALSQGDAAPSVIFDDVISFGRRGGVPADDARPWVRLDLADVGDGSGEVAVLTGEAASSVVAIPPSLIVDLAAGALTGSIETVGTEDLDGVETTHYRVNVSIEKALEDVRRSRYPEDRRELIERFIELLGVDGDVHAAEVWLDTDGGLRRFSVALTQRPVIKVEFALVVTVDITEIGGTYDVAEPTPEQVLSVDSVVRFITTVTGGQTADAPIPPSIAATLGTADPETDPETEAEAEA